MAVGVGAYFGSAILTAPRPQDASGWSRSADLPEPRGETAVATTTDGRLFVIGGLTGPTFETSRTVSILDARTGAWAAGPPLPEPRHHAAAVAVGDSVYVTGGAASVADGTPRVEAWVLGAGASEWSPIADMPVGRMGHRMVDIGGQVYVIGGVDGPQAGTAQGAVLLYDTVTGGWAAKSPLPLVRDHLGAVVVDGEIWVIGGRAGGINVSRVDIYDASTDEWRAGPSLPDATSGAAEAALGTVILVSGGEDPSPGAMVDRHWMLDAGTGSSQAWRPLPPPPLTVHGAPGAVLDGRFVIAGGSARAGGQSNTAWSALTQILDAMP